MNRMANGNDAVVVAENMAASNPQVSRTERR
jgi:hypothetical protein